MWLVDLRRFGGGRNFFDEEEDAKRCLASAMKDAAQFGRLAFELGHKERTRYLAIESKLAEFGTTLEQVVQHWERTHRPTARKSIGEAVAECLAAKTAAGRRKRSTQQLGYALASLVVSVGAESPCGDVTPAMIQTWLDNPKWGMRTRKGRLIDAHTFFAYAIRQGWAAQDPTGKVEPITLDAGPIEILTIEQVRRLLEATRKHRPEFLPFVVLGVFCGIRPDEIKQLMWHEVNLETGYVEIPAHVAKRVRGGSRRRRLIKIQPNALAWLKLGGELPPVGWQDRWDVVRAEAGFSVKIKRGGKRKPTKGEPWPRGGMRHSFCTYCLPVFGERDESRWAGHSPDEAQAHYDGKATKETAEQFWAILPAPAHVPNV
jgi:integrase